MIQLPKPRLTQVLLKLGSEFQGLFDEWLRESYHLGDEDEEGTSKSDMGIPPRIKAARQIVQQIRESQ